MNAIAARAAMAARPSILMSLTLNISFSPGRNGPRGLCGLRFTEVTASARIKGRGRPQRASYITRASISQSKLSINGADGGCTPAQAQLARRHCYSTRTTSKR
jgi:hypothetical protein